MPFQAGTVYRVERSEDPEGRSGVKERKAEMERKHPALTHPKATRDLTHRGEPSSNRRGRSTWVCPVVSELGPARIECWDQ